MSGDPNPRQSSLFDRFGGREGVDALIEAFYRRVEVDSHIRSVYPDDLGPGKQKLKLFFEQWLGGEPVYSARYGHPRLRRRHFPFVIDERAAGLWLRYMREAFHEHGVSSEDEAELFASLGSLARHMVNAGQDVPREPLHDAILD